MSVISISNEVKTLCESLEYIYIYFPGIILKFVNTCFFLKQSLFEVVQAHCRIDPATE